jgi:histidinol phosphatase-like enzyme
MKTAVFFERDGILNECENVGGHQAVPTRLEQFKVTPEAPRLLGELKADGHLLIATTNQPGVSRGEVRRNEVDLMHAILRRRLPLDDLFQEAAFKWGLDLDRCFVISDKWQDAKAAQIAGCTSVLVRSPWIGDDHHDFVVGSLAEAVGKIRQLCSAAHYAAA